MQARGTYPSPEDLDAVCVVIEVLKRRDAPPVDFLVALGERFSDCKGLVDISQFALDLVNEVEDIPLLASLLRE